MRLNNKELKRRMPGQRVETGRVDASRKQKTKKRSNSCQRNNHSFIAMTDFTEYLNTDMLVLIITGVDPLTRLMLRLTSKRLNKLCTRVIRARYNTFNRCWAMWRLFHAYGTVPQFEWFQRTWPAKKCLGARADDHVAVALGARNFPVVEFLLSRGYGRAGLQSLFDQSCDVTIELLAWCHEHGWIFSWVDIWNAKFNGNDELAAWLVENAVPTTRKYDFYLF